MAHIHDKVLIIDCQTTSMHPKTGHLLQLGWCVYEPTQPVEIQVRTLKLPSEEKVPKKIFKLLKLDENILDEAQEVFDVINEFHEVIKQLGENKYVLAHYISFELSFLKPYFLSYLNQSTFIFEPVCTQKLSKKLLPCLTSHTLKGMAGYLRFDAFEANKVTAHIQLTLKLWEKLKRLLIEKDIYDFRSVFEWTNKKIPAKKTSFSYNIERLSRLELSNKPGVYRMFSHENKLLYIGKATSLKNRVNSYFRGIKNRDKRKLEMLAQVWSIETTVCESVLEAELLEAYEIRRLKPPYNIMLNQSPLNLIFYHRSFESYASEKSSIFREGPFRLCNSLNDLKEAHRCFMTNHPFLLYHEIIAAKELKKAWSLFSKKHKIPIETLKQVKFRTLLALGYKFLKQFEQCHGKYIFEKWWKAEKKKNLKDEKSLAEQFSERIYRLFIRAAICRRDSWQLKNLLDSEILIKSKKKQFLVKEYFFSQFRHESDCNQLHSVYYDQLMILLNAKRKNLISII